MGALLSLQRLAGNSSVTQLIDRHKLQIQRQKKGTGASRPTGSDPCLLVGSSGPKVIELQKALNANREPIAENGTFDEGIKREVLTLPSPRPRSGKMGVGEPVLEEPETEKLELEVGPAVLE